MAGEKHVPPSGGRSTYFPGKMRQKPITVTLTQDARDVLESNLARTGMSRSDFVEALVRQYAGAIDQTRLT